MRGRCSDFKKQIATAWDCSVHCYDLGQAHAWLVLLLITGGCTSSVFQTTMWCSIGACLWQNCQLHHETWCQQLTHLNDKDRLEMFTSLSEPVHITSIAHCLHPSEICNESIGCRVQHFIVTCYQASERIKKCLTEHSICTDLDT